MVKEKIGATTLHVSLLGQQPMRDRLPTEHRAGKMAASVGAGPATWQRLRRAALPLYPPLLAASGESHFCVGVAQSLTPLWTLTVLLNIHAGFCKCVGTCAFLVKRWTTPSVQCHLCDSNYIDNVRSHYCNVLFFIVNVDASSIGLYEGFVFKVLDELVKNYLEVRDDSV
ncbi:hypothetical protein J6590_073670 [Homalodisca vitripennis]|nr:hypothetical protein J6590_073670 [Homalodisca vitripennis]